MSYNDWDKRADIAEMKGQTFTKVYTRSSDTELVFENNEIRYVFYHMQGCCENVYIEDICGDLADLENSVLLNAEEATSRDPVGTGAEMNLLYILADKYKGESCTYTFYKFATIKGYVDVRWLGESNGYYSEAVDLGWEEVV